LPVGEQHSDGSGSIVDVTPPLDSPFLAACRGEPVAHTPVWFMRQAGRSLPEYRAIRTGVPMLESCRTPDLVTEITMQPVRRYGVDAAIFYSDIVVPLVAIGVGVDIKPGIGPVLDAPFRTRADLERLRPLEPDDVDYVTQAIGSLVAELGQTPLIGFAGAPFTLACYLVEGGPSKDHATTRAFMHTDPQLWSDLLARLADITAAFLTVQVSAGASAVQLFDSWAGVLSRRDYSEFVLPHSRTVLDALPAAGYHVPRIHFGVGTGELLDLMGDAGADVVGVDWRIPLHVAAARVGPGRSLQGNLDPAVLAAPADVVTDEVARVLAEGGSARGHVFNLGHGVPPWADPDVLARVVEQVHAAPVAGSPVVG
jgi:uroporphyrinogen decarboxylase